MLNLAFIGSEADAELYRSIMNRINGATLETKSIDGLLLNPDTVDALVIHAPAEVLQDLVKTVSKAGKPILAGPILAKNAADLDTFLKTAEQSDLIPACPWRSIPAIKTLKASIDAGNLGEIGLIRLHRWNSNQTESKSDMFDRVIPDIDIATWFFGTQPKKVFSLKSAKVGEYIQVHLHFDNGGMAIIDEASALPDGGDYFSLTVIGGTGAAYADDHRNMNLIVDGVYPHAIRTNHGAVHIASQVQEFVDTVSGNASPSFTHQDVSRVLQISDAVIDTEAGSKVSVWEDGKYV